MSAKNKVRFTDMAIWIDENILKPDMNEAKAFKYLRNLAYMLAKKKNYFKNYEDYNMFADYMATIVYMRMTSKNQYLPEDDPKYRSPIKSCLNYMKGILYARKCAYEHEFYRQSTKEEAEFDTAKTYYESQLNSLNTGLLEIDIELYLGKINSVIRKVLLEGPYSKNRGLYYKLYVATLLSLLRNFTLSNKNKARLDNRNFFARDIVWKDKYDVTVSQVIEEEGSTAVIAYNLDESYKDYIEIVLQKIKKNIINEINELVREYTLPDQLVEDMLMSGLSVGDNNEI